MSERRARKASVTPVESRAGEAFRTSLPARGILHTLAGDTETVWQVPEEVPLAVQFNSQNYAVMMGTPADFEDFALGFAIAEASRFAVQFNGFFRRARVTVFAMFEIARLHPQIGSA